MLCSATALLLLLHVGAAEKCYVCVPSDGSVVEEMEQMFPAPLKPCDAFDGSAPFQRSCPAPEDKGCLTQINGTEVARKCANIAVNECFLVNGINYCYCSGALCNGAASSLRTATTQRPSSPMEVEASYRPSSTRETLPADDDDDDVEGSGSFHQSTMQKPVLRVTPVTSTSPAPHSGCDAFLRTEWLFLLVTHCVLYFPIW